MHDQINAWLLEPTDYAEGLRLLVATGRTGIVIKTLSMGEDAYTRSRLEAELRKWVAESVQTATAQPVGLMVSELLGYGTGIHSTPDMWPPLPETMAEPVPSGDAAVREQTYDLMNERSELKARIRAYAGDNTKQEQRRDWAYRILSIGEQLDELYSRLDFFDQYGYLPPIEEPSATSDDTAKLMNMRSYVSRYEAKLRKTNLTPEQRQSAQNLLKKYQDERDRLVLKLSK